MGLRGREAVCTGCSPCPREGPCVSLVLVHVLLSHTLLQSQPWASGTRFLRQGAPFSCFPFQGLWLVSPGSQFTAVKVS